MKNIPLKKKLKRFFCRKDRRHCEKFLCKKIFKNQRLKEEFEIGNSGKRIGKTKFDENTFLEKFEFLLGKNWKVFLKNFETLKNKLKQKNSKKKGLKKIENRIGKRNFKEKDVEESFCWKNLKNNWKKFY